MRGLLKDMKCGPWSLVRGGSMKCRSTSALMNLARLHA